MIKKFDTCQGKFEFTYHPRKTVPLVMPDSGAPRNLSDVYGSYSSAKADAFDRCRNAFDALDGFGWSIESHSVRMFTIGFYFEYPNPGQIYYAKLTSYYWHLYRVER